jgi:hypothetical protein
LARSGVDLVIRLDAGTVLLQWATGGLLFLWVTTRRRQVSIGYGWLVRGIYLALALGAVAVGEWFGVPVAAGAGAALAASVSRRRETPRLDLVAPAAGLVGLVVAGVGAGGPDVLAVVRTVVGAAFLGCVSDAMLLGHWYLVQPGLGRAPLHELNRWLARVWPLEVAALLWPTGMLSVLSGRIDDGWNGLLGWFWVACAATTLILTFVTAAALKERAYSAVMAATGLLYLAILTAFGTDLVARALLAG